MKKRIKLLALLLGLQTIILCSDSDQDMQLTTDTQNSQAQSDEKPKADVKNNPKSDNKVKTDVVKAASKYTPSKTTLFVNGRVNTIILVITNDKNQQFKIIVKAGMHYECTHKPQSLKKVVCYEIATPNTTLSQSDLKTYSAFVFNTDQKLEKYNFITIQHKHGALKRASETKNETLFNEISDQNVYYA